MTFYEQLTTLIDDGATPNEILVKIFPTQNNGYPTIKSMNIGDTITQDMIQKIRNMEIRLGETQRMNKEIHSLRNRLRKVDSKNISIDKKNTKLYKENHVLKDECYRMGELLKAGKVPKEIIHPIVCRQSGCDDVIL